jgi:hypothetical protein
LTSHLSASGEGTVTIPAGKSSVSIRLAVEPDAILEWDETARVELLPAPTGSQPYGIVPNRASADVTILDDELLGGMLSRNVDGESTGLSSATVDLGAATIDLAQGEATVSLPLVLGDFGPRYTSHDNLRPIVALETQLPLAGTGSVTATLTFGGIASETVTFTNVPANETVRFVLLGSDEIRRRLSTGRYDYDIALRDAEGRVRTIRGATEVVNRVEETFGEVEFGRRWWLPLLDRLVPGDGISPVMRSASPIATRITPTSRLAPLGAATGNGMTLVRGDGTTAWYAAKVDADAAILATEGSADSVWKSGTASGGHELTHLVSTAGLSRLSATRRLTLSNLSAGQTYQLFATWTADADRASNAAYTVSGARPVAGVGTTTTIVVNQRYVPGELDAHGVQWRSLGFFYVASGSSITIDVATSYTGSTGQTVFADGLVVADTVMAVKNWTFTTPAGSFNQLDAGAIDPANGFYAGPAAPAPITPPDAFTLLAKTGTRYRFDAQGLLQGTIDRNENRVAVADAGTPAPLPGSPKRELREYASLHRKPHPIPSARASGFKERDRQTRQTGNQLLVP